ncbi:MAG: BspA family leucine-rich repeat surface protein [Marinifilaceae bacterium]|jgi:hypothetical protein|nr:BspA family leucine-rich repeat surface protein [Marinifilaceae bacterium]
MKKNINPLIALLIFITCFVCSCTEDTDFETNQPINIENRLYCIDTVDFGYVPIGVKVNNIAQIYNATDFPVTDFKKQGGESSFYPVSNLSKIKISPLNKYKLKLEFQTEEKIDKVKTFKFQLTNSFGIDVNVFAKATTTFDSKDNKMNLDREKVKIYHYAKGAKIKKTFNFRNNFKFPLNLEKSSVEFEGDKVELSLYNENEVKAGSFDKDVKCTIGSGELLKLNVLIEPKVNTAKDSSKISLKFDEIDEKLEYILKFKVDDNGFHNEAIKLNIDVIGNGVVKGMEGIIKENDKVKLTAFPDDYNKFSHWTTNSGQTIDSNPLEIEASKDNIYTAVFQKVYFIEEEGAIIATPYAVIGKEYLLETDDGNVKYEYVNEESLRKIVKKWGEGKLPGDDLSKYVTTGITDMSYLFEGIDITEHSGLGLNISGWDVLDVNTMQGMFQNCKLNGLMSGKQDIWDLKDNIISVNFNTGAVGVPNLSVLEK